MNNEYYILADGERKGPFDLQELTERGLDVDAQVATSLADDWQNVSYLPEFAEYFHSKGYYFPTEDNLANFGWRGIAFIIDYILLSVVVLFIELQAGWVNIPASVSISTYNKLPAKDLMIMEISVVAAFLLYNSILEASNLRGGLGKKLCRLMVVDEDGKKLTLIKAFLRNLGSLMSFTLYGLPYLTILMSDRQQTWYDRLAKAYTLKNNE